MTARSSDWRPSPTVCRCCFAEGCYKDISTEYFWMGKREVYSEMLSDTFDVSIAYSQSGGPNSHSRLICEPCISRLRDASDFKRQVQECERVFMQHLDPGSSSLQLESETEQPVTVKEVKIERVKKEQELTDDDDFGDMSGFPDDDDDDLDDQPLQTLASKVPKKESVELMELIENPKPVKRKSTRVKAVPVKKAKKSTPKASASKEEPKTEKKKKERNPLGEARSNAKLLLTYTTACPFKMPRECMVCVYCEESFREPAIYREHVMTEHKDFSVAIAFSHLASNFNDYVKTDCTDLACRICSQPCETLNEAALHLFTNHNKNIYLQAEPGLQMFKFGPEKWRCTHCKNVFATIRALSRHTNTHYHKYTCDICAKSYLNMENLRKHYILTHEKKIFCPRCKEEFATEELKKEHIKATKYCWPFTCPMCGQRFHNVRLKTDHLSQEHGVTKKHVCAQCGQEFPNATQHNSHFIRTHTESALKCPYCDLKFVKKIELDDHVVNHTKEKKFQCEFCFKWFSRKKNLKQHLWIHSEKKRFNCTLCDKSFNQKTCWTSHMKSYHPGLLDNVETKHTVTHTQV